VTVRRLALTLQLTLVGALFASPSPVVTAKTAAAPWSIDRAHSRVTFTVTKWGFVEVEGRFLDFSGTVFYDPAQPSQSRVDWRVRVASVETGEPKRDEALQMEEYFDVARHPDLRFVSEQVRALTPSELEATGTITIRGRSRPLTIKIRCGGRHVAPGEGTFEMFSTEFTVNRYDFGVVGGSVLGPVISRDVKVKILAAARVGR
jgi:polyisoprenoid-binding protein YceI